MREILQSLLPYDIPQRLPGTAPMDPADWIMVDDAFAPQMALRDALIAERPAEVLALDVEARPAAEELLAVVLGVLSGRGDYSVAADSVTRPDGVTVPLELDSPMRTLGRLVQQDLCLMEKRGGEEHVLTGAVLCFPAYWTLAEKFLRPMTAIHTPVPEYDAALARRVQRLFDGIQVGRPMWRANELRRSDPGLFQPRPEAAEREHRVAPEGPYLRSERQSLWRLEQTRAVVFGIHTHMVRLPL
jgi:dimethylamine monooxygenase subunit A